MNNKLVRIRVSGVLPSEKSIGALVNVTLNDNDDVIAANTLVWFPRSIASLEEIEKKDMALHTKYFINAPKWFLDKNNVNYKTL